MYGEWVEIINPNEVGCITFLVCSDSDPESLKAYLLERFHRILRNRAVQIETFDNESTKILVEIIRNNSSNHNLVYMILKMFVYHTYMVAYHKMNNDEYRLLRFKLKKVLDPTAVY
jgi:hypothetical protein